MNQKPRTAKELNKEIRQLEKKIARLKNETDIKKIILSEFYETIEKDIKPSFLKCLNDDPGFILMNKASIKIMLYINHHFTFIQWYRFGINMEGMKF